MRRAAHGVVVAVLTVILSAAAAIAQMYRWVDEQGNVQFGQGIDSVPERFRKGLKPYEPPAPQSAPPEAAWRQKHERCRTATAFESSMEPEVRRIFTKLFTAEVRQDVGLYQIDLATILDKDDFPAGFICYANQGERSHTILVPVRTIERSLSYGRLELNLAALLAHELAHAARHAKAEGRTGAVEREADELGVYYFERAGYDCRLWVPNNPPHAGYATAEEVRMACILAKKGMRPPRRNP